MDKRLIQALKVVLIVAIIGSPFWAIMVLVQEAAPRDEAFPTLIVGEIRWIESGEIQTVPLPHNAKVGSLYEVPAVDDMFIVRSIDW